jgi:osmotically-inducible protein OsmY
MKMRHPSIIAVFAAWLITPAIGAAMQQTAPPPSADNTRANKQPGTTADDQSQSKPDLALAQKIRQAITKDKTLSTNAHNCKVVTRDGSVTLRGPVDSAKEKAALEKIATGIAGKGKVTNELTVQSGK